MQRRAPQIAVDEIVRKHGGNAGLRHRLQAFPRGNAVDFDDVKPSFAIAYQVYTRVVDLQRTARLLRNRADLRVRGQVDRYATRTLRYIGDPARPVPLHGGHCAAMNYKHAQVVPSFSAGRDESLQV